MPAAKKTTTFPKTPTGTKKPVAKKVAAKKALPKFDASKNPPIPGFKPGELQVHVADKTPAKTLLAARRSRQFIQTDAQAPARPKRSFTAKGFGTLLPEFSFVYNDGSKAINFYNDNTVEIRIRPEIDLPYNTYGAKQLQELTPETNLLLLKRFFPALSLGVAADSDGFYQCLTSHQAKSGWALLVKPGEWKLVHTEAISATFIGSTPLGIDAPEYPMVVDVLACIHAETSDHMQLEYGYTLTERLKLSPSSSLNLKRPQNAGLIRKMGEAIDAVGQAETRAAATIESISSALHGGPLTLTDLAARGAAATQKVVDNVKNMTKDEELKQLRAASPNDLISLGWKVRTHFVIDDEDYGPRPTYVWILTHNGNLSTTWGYSDAEALEEMRKGEGLPLMNP